VLRGLEGVVDKLAFGLIDLVPTCEDKAKADQKALDESLDDAIDAYAPKIPKLGGILS
jgi:hypothetical protein